MKVDTTNFIEQYCMNGEATTSVMNFTDPFVLTAGEVLKVDSGADCRCLGCFIGYETDA